MLVTLIFYQIKQFKCYINCQPREVYLFQMQSHTVYAESKKQSNVVVKITLITPCSKQTEVYLSYRKDNPSIADFPGLH